MGDEQITYKDAGVDYSNLDPFKRLAQESARRTADYLERHGYRELEASRGESAYLIDIGDRYLAHVEEGLGTKNLVADAMLKLAECDYYASVAIDTVAMIVNDMLTVGALPVSLAMHAAVGDDAWFTNEARTKSLIEGWLRACRYAHCAWGGGETPTLKGIVNPEAIVLSGSGVGFVRKDQIMLGSRICAGDAIVILTSSGIHANGLSLARKVAEKLPESYLHRLPSGETFGRVLLRPTHIYARLIHAMQQAGIECHYGVNITGHGWRKLMRASQPFNYVLDELPPVPEEFDLIQEMSKNSDRDMYGTFNMGGGFALFLPQDSAHQLMELAATLKLSYKIIYAGRVEAAERKRVVLVPKDIEYTAEDLQVR
ncbi:AIR synthase-related protein [Patescibacteria group bacterium]|jgi:phosphoribosylformylglycinamidine cyclo-ligase|nr:AIR synthase-related protein [Patescibacteria group bacterium]